MDVNAMLGVGGDVGYVKKVEGGRGVGSGGSGWGSGWM